MKLLFLCIHFILFSSQRLFAQASYKAVVLSPVVDVFGIADTDQASTYMQKSRIRQLIFNETVVVSSPWSDQLIIAITVPHIVFGVDDQGKFLQSGFCNATGVKPVADFPDHMRYWLPSERKKSASVLLIKPVYDPQTGYTFSFGTRMVKKEHAHDSAECTVGYIDPKTMAVMFLKLPQGSWMADVPRKMNQKEARNRFMYLLKTLLEDVQQRGAIIPYVWGGASYTGGIVDQGFVFENDEVIRPGDMPIVNGFDCSGLVYRLADCAGVAYGPGGVSSLFYNNTAMICKFSNVITKFENIEDGDLIAWPGHVMIIYSVKDSLLCEARGYRSGVGKVQILPVNKITNCADVRSLWESVQQKRSVALYAVTGSSTFIQPQFYKLSNTP